MPQKMKEAILTQDGLRRGLNTSLQLFDQMREKVVVDFNIQMANSGYREEVRIMISTW